MAYIEYLLCLPAFNISICVASCLHLCTALNAVLQKEFAPAQQIKWFSSCLSFAPLNYLHANESPAEALPKQSLKTASWGAERGHFHLLPPVLPSSMTRSTSTLPKAEVGTFSFLVFFFFGLARDTESFGKAAVGTSSIPGLSEVWQWDRCVFSPKSTTPRELLLNIGPL